MAKKLTEQQKRFADAFLVSLNATDAYRSAGYKATGNSAEVNASRLLRNAQVVAYLAERRSARMARVEITQDDVLRELRAVMTSDTNEIVQYRRGCCRHCWGAAFRYQCTPSEQEQRRKDYNRERGKLMQQGAPEDLIPPFDELGGIGFNKKRDPNPDCPECFGDGRGEIFVADTRKLPPALKSLYAGVKIGKDGLEVKLHSKDKATELVARHLGMLKDKVEVEVGDKLAEQLAAARRRRANGNASGA
ncbi:terminase small subunit [Burkholderia sp. Ax-1724]|uniref:terminase small subunit n=1 Tax=Burkholderia sp. Ax-1724 TaxID=2608336 RepID=UPI001422E81F|nr:terminase small subunit [Burkholderia sp. Ax-1724]NIF51421.1 terminase small subunit [Burkholderia sp. Ax-1724]